GFAFINFSKNPLTNRRHPPYSSLPNRRFPPNYPEEASSLPPDSASEKDLYDASLSPKRLLPRDHPRLLPDDHPRHLGGDHRPAEHPSGPRPLDHGALLGTERLPPPLRRPAPARRPRRRHPRPPPGLHRRHRSLHLR